MILQHYGNMDKYVCIDIPIYVCERSLRIAYIDIGDLRWSIRIMYHIKGQLLHIS